MAKEVRLKLCPNIPTHYIPKYLYSAKDDDITPIASKTYFSECIESCCAAYKDGMCMMFNTSIYLPVKERS